MAKADQDLLASGGRLLGSGGHTADSKQADSSSIAMSWDMGSVYPSSLVPTCLPGSMPDWGLGGAISVTCAYPFWINDLAWLSRSLIATLRYVPCLFNQQ